MTLHYKVVIPQRLASPYKKRHLWLSFWSRKSHLIQKLHSAMENQAPGQVTGIPVASVSYAEELQQEPGSVPGPVSPFLHLSSSGSSSSKQNRKDSVIKWMSSFGKKADSYVQSIRGHVGLGPKISQTVKGKMSLTARIIQAGGVERVFRQVFAAEEGEKLMKASQCYLWTTAGPIAGVLFISTKKIAFHSDRSLRLTSPKGGLIRVPYKVLIPLTRVRRASSSENLDKQNVKCIQIVTQDDFDFWFMGFVSYQKTFKYLKHAISGCQ